MIDHVKLFATDPAASRAFYEQALKPLGYRVMLEPAPGVVGMGATRPDFWIAPGGRRADALPSRLPRRLRAGGRRPSTPPRWPRAARTTARPGLRPHYHQNYYGAFVLDPDGNNVEAVYHGAMQPETSG